MHNSNEVEEDDEIFKELCHLLTVSTPQQYSDDISGAFDLEVDSIKSGQLVRLQHTPQQPATQDCLITQQCLDISNSQSTSDVISPDFIRHPPPPLALAPSETLANVQVYSNVITHMPPECCASPTRQVADTVTVPPITRQPVYMYGALGSGATAIPNLPPSHVQAPWSVQGPHVLHSTHSLMGSVSNSRDSAVLAAAVEDVAGTMTSAMMGDPRGLWDRGTGLADALGLKEDGIQPPDVVKRIGELLLVMESPACAFERKTVFEENPDCRRQHAFLAIGGQLEKERSNLGGTMSGRQVTEIRDGSIFVAVVSGTRCTCGVTRMTSCKEQQHPYDKVFKYFLVYKNWSATYCSAKQKPFPVGKPSGTEVEEMLVQGGAAPSARQSTRKSKIWLWEPEQPRAVLWHIKPRVTPGSDGGEAARADAWMKAPVTTAVPAAAGPVEGGVVAMQAMVQTMAAPLHTQALRMAAESVAAKRPRIESSCTALVPFAASHGQQQLLKSEALPYQQLLAGSPIDHAVVEPWLGSLQLIRGFLIGCVAVPITTASSAVHNIFRPSAGDFRSLLERISVEHLEQMRCPKTGQGLAHLLVTPPRFLLTEDDGKVSPLYHDDGLPEAEALGLIEALLSRLADGPGGMQAAQRIWSRMLAMQDARHEATALHRAAQFGHRLRILQEGVLPYASRAALLKQTSHIYLCCHSACRSGHEPAARLLVSAITQVVKEMSVAPLLQPLLSSRLLPAVGFSSSGVGVTGNNGGGGDGSTLAAHLEERLLSATLYSLKNKFFTGRNTAEEGYVSPAGRTGHELLTKVCAEVRQPMMHRYGYSGPAAAAAATTAFTTPSSSGQTELLLLPSQLPLHQAPPDHLHSAPYLYTHGPTPPFPSPAPHSKKKVMDLLGYVKCLADMLDNNEPRLMQLWQQ